MDLLRAPAVIQPITALGYPLYLASILGVWKLLGAAAITAPGLPRLKEWAYAGVLFDRDPWENIEFPQDRGMDLKLLRESKPGTLGPTVRIPG